MKQEPIEPVSEADKNKSRYKKKTSIDAPPPAVSVVSVALIHSFEREYSEIDYQQYNVFTPEHI